MKAARAFYEFDAARRVRHDGRDDLIYRRNRRVLDLLPAGARCLDVGCGAGGFAPLLAERFQVVSGVDLSLTLAKAASTRGMRALCAQTDPERRCGRRRVAVPRRRVRRDRLL